MITKQQFWRRVDMRTRLKAGQVFDVVIIGAGATGLGIAVDAASRGLSVAVLDAQDFCAGTSSRSTKLIHGGVRYLSNPRNWPLIKEALFARRLLLQNAPQLVRPQSFVVPCYSYAQALWYGAGLGLYSLLSSGGKGMHGVTLSGRMGALGQLPGIARKGLKAALSYSDAQFDDAGLAMALLRTAVKAGAAVLNHAAVCSMEHDGRRITSLTVHDKIKNVKFNISGKVVMNCAGVWVDSVRRMVDVEVSPLVRISRGTHIVLDRSFMPTGNAMVVPKTSDGRVLFCIPWQGRLLVGTTDIEQGQAPFDPQPTSDEIDFLIDNANKYLTRQIRREDVKASFAGLRPLFNSKRTGLNEGTANMTRSYAVVPEFGNMLTVVGGKWTSYRAMAELALKTAQQMRLVPMCGCMTRSLPLVVQNRLELESLQRDLLQNGAPRTPAEKERLRTLIGVEVFTSGVCTAQDFLFRRLRIGVLDAALAKELEPLVTETVKDCLRGREARRFRSRYGF